MYFPSIPRQELTSIGHAKGVIPIVRYRYDLLKYELLKHEQFYFLALLPRVVRTSIYKGHEWV